MGLKLVSSRRTLPEDVLLQFGCLLHATITLDASKSQSTVRSLRIITNLASYAIHKLWQLVDAMDELEVGRLSLILSVLPPRDVPQSDSPIR